MKKSIQQFLQEIKLVALTHASTKEATVLRSIFIDSLESTSPKAVQSWVISLELLSHLYQILLAINEAKLNAALKTDLQTKFSQLKDEVFKSLQRTLHLNDAIFYTLEIFYNLRLHHARLYPIKKSAYLKLEKMVHDILVAGDAALKTQDPIYTQTMEQLTAQTWPLMLKIRRHSNDATITQLFNCAHSALTQNFIERFSSALLTYTPICLDVPLHEFSPKATQQLADRIGEFMAVNPQSTHYALIKPVLTELKKKPTDQILALSDWVEVSECLLNNPQAFDVSILPRVYTRNPGFTHQLLKWVRERDIPSLVNNPAIIALVQVAESLPLGKFFCEQLVNRLAHYLDCCVYNSTDFVRDLHQVNSSPLVAMLESTYPQTLTNFKLKVRDMLNTEANNELIRLKKINQKDLTPIIEHGHLFQYDHEHYPLKIRIDVLEYFFNDFIKSVEDSGKSAREKIRYLNHSSETMAQKTDQKAELNKKIDILNAKKIRLTISIQSRETSLKQDYNAFWQAQDEILKLEQKLKQCILQGGNTEFSRTEVELKRCYLKYQPLREQTYKNRDFAERLALIDNDKGEMNNVEEQTQTLREEVAQLDQQITDLNTKTRLVNQIGLALREPILGSADKGYQQSQSQANQAIRELIKAYYQECLTQDTEEMKDLIYHRKGIVLSIGSQNHWDIEPFLYDFFEEGTLPLQKNIIRMLLRLEQQRPIDKASFQQTVRRYVENLIDAASSNQIDFLDVIQIVSNLSAKKIFDKKDLQSILVTYVSDGCVKPMTTEKYRCLLHSDLVKYCDESETLSETLIAAFYKLKRHEDPFLVHIHQLFHLRISPEDRFQLLMRLEYFPQSYARMADFIPKQELESLISASEVLLKEEYDHPGYVLYYGIHALLVDLYSVHYPVSQSSCVALQSSRIEVIAQYPLYHTYIQTLTNLFKGQCDQLSLPQVSWVMQGLEYFESFAAKGAFAEFAKKDKTIILQQLAVFVKNIMTYVTQEDEKIKYLGMLVPYLRLEGNDHEADVLNHLKKWIYQRISHSIDPISNHLEGYLQLLNLFNPSPIREELIHYLSFLKADNHHVELVASLKKLKSHLQGLMVVNPVIEGLIKGCPDDISDIRLARGFLDGVIQVILDNQFSAKVSGQTSRWALSSFFSGRGASYAHLKDMALEIKRILGLIFPELPPEYRGLPALAVANSG